MKNFNELFLNLQTHLDSLEQKELANYKMSVLDYEKKHIEMYCAEKDGKKIEKKLEYFRELLNSHMFFWRLRIKHTLFESISKFLNFTDVFHSINIINGKKGLELTCTVVREGKEYNFRTEAIEAGGYNIQVFHYRYITSTTLEKNVDKNVTSKVLKINQKIEEQEYFLNKAKSRNNKFETPYLQLMEDEAKERQIKHFSSSIEKLKAKLNQITN